MPAWLLCKAPGAGGNIRLPRDVTEEKRTGFGDTHRTWSYLKSFFFHRQELSFMGQKTKCRYETLEPAHVQPRSWGPRQLEQWDGRELASSTKVTLACGSNLCLWKASKNFFMSYLSQQLPNKTQPRKRYCRAVATEHPQTGRGQRFNLSISMALDSFCSQNQAMLVKKTA